MEKSFWLERWQRREIGFHRDAAHPALARHWRDVGCAAETRVFVPLAGKSRDMVWLRDEGHPVVAVEWSRLAVEDFFRENDLEPRVVERPQGTLFSADGFDVWCADFFALSRHDLGPFGAVYDRAALVALPPGLRAAYARRVAELCVPGDRVLLVSFEYDEARMTGPPFSVPEAEVRALYGSAFDVRVLGSEPPSDVARFAARGVPEIREVSYLLVRQ